VVPCPDRFTVTEGALTALELITKLPLKLPTDVGLNLTIMVHDAEGVKTLPFEHVPPALENGVAGLVIELIVRFAEPLF